MWGGVGVLKQLGRAWADSLQHSPITGSRYLTGKTHCRDDEKKRAAASAC